jgi:putative aldouronate transport system permease protein
VIPNNLTATQKRKRPGPKNDAGSWPYLKSNYEFYLMLLPVVLFYVIFKYIPMYGVLIAFKDYNFMLGVLKSPWVGWEVFREIFRDSSFWNALYNTLWLNFLQLVINFPLPIIFALFLNEIKAKCFKKVVQSISYLPHFISWVIVYGLILTFTNTDNGLISVVFRSLGLQPINFLTNKVWWYVIYIGSGVWKSVGWATILYISALGTIDSGLYEAASIDGAGRFKSMWHITLPGIRSTIAIVLIMNIGKMMTIGFDQPYLLGNSMVSDISNVLSTYTYDIGLIRAQYSLATAIGLFQAVVNLALLLTADFTIRHLGEVARNE